MSDLSVCGWVVCGCVRACVRACVCVYGDNGVCVVSPWSLSLLGNFSRCEFRLCPEYKGLKKFATVQLK